MTTNSWTEQAIERFFIARKSPTRRQCDQFALFITGTSAIVPVDVPGSLSYTVLCPGTRSQIQGQHPQDTVVVSFRESTSSLDEELVRLARAVHGFLVPYAKCHGIMSDSDPPLVVYTMPLLPGVACLTTLSSQVDMDSDEEAKHICFITHLARYFARCWTMPQPTDPQERNKSQAGISRKLAGLKASSSTIVPPPMVSELENILPLLFASDYPQVLTHGDFSQTNILVNPDTYEVTGIVDWSLAAVQPFGLELDSLFLMTGYMDLSGWHDYTCHPRLWDAFWVASGIEDDGVARRENIRFLAEAAAKIGAILRYAFKREADGRPSEALSTSDNVLDMLKAWLSSPVGQ